MNQYFNTIELQTEQQWIDVVLDKLFQVVDSFIKRNGTFNIAVSGGSTPGVVFKHWAKDERMLALWKQVRFYWVDERLVPSDHVDSNYGNAMKKLGVLPATFKPIYDGIGEIEEAVGRYREALKRLPQENDVPVFDMILLGMGEDGHTASLFPATKALYESKESVVLNKVTQLNTNRITLTYPVLMSAANVMVLFNGGVKKQLLQNMKTAATDYPIHKLIDRVKPLQWIYY